MSIFDTSPEDAVDERGRGNPVPIAAIMYDAGVADTAKLAEDWDLTPEQHAELVAHVREAWAEGRWDDRRKQVERRRAA